MRKATSSLSSLTYIVSTETNQESFCKGWRDVWGESAVAGCEDWLGRGTTSHWGFMIRSLENSNQDWLLLSFHWLDNNCPITGWQPCAGSLCLMCPLSSLLYWSVSVGQWGLRRDDTSMQLLLGEHADRRGGWSSLHNMTGKGPVQVVISIQY